MVDPIDPGPEIPPPGPPSPASAPAPPPGAPPPAPAQPPGAPPPWAQSPTTPNTPGKSGGPGKVLLGCLVAIAVLVLLFLVSIVLLIFLGGQVSSMLSETGQALRTAAPVHSPPIASPTASPASTPTTAPAPTITFSTPAVEATDEPLPSWMTELPHQAPEVEAVVPAKVSGLPLTIWSVRGERWLDLAGQTPAEIAALRQKVEKAGGSLDDCVSVIAGRTSVEDDPPYFVYVYRIPDAALDTVSPIILGTTGWIGDLEPDRFETATLGGKEVFVGTNDMLKQSEHQRGRPYWYELDAETLVIVVTDEESWAIDALRQLP